MGEDSLTIKIMKKLTALAILLTLTGCFSSPREIITETMIEAESGGTVDVDISEDGYKFEDEEGNVYEFGTDSDIPEDWPEVFTVKKDFKVISASSFDMAGAVSMTASFSCDDCDKDEVMEYYREEMAAEGWEEDGYYEFASEVVSASINFTKDENRSASIQFTSDSDMTTVGLNYMED